MALTKLIKDEDAQEAHDFLVAVLRAEIDMSGRGFSLRMNAAQAIVRFWQTQERFGQSRIEELAQNPKASADPRDYAALTDEELEAKVTQFADYPRNRSAGHHSAS